MAEPGQSAAPEYDVCLSFADEQREYVNEVATLLRDKNIRVFYDDFLGTGLLGEDLIEYFDKIFRLRSRYCVVFISAEYATKQWTRTEWRSILNRAFHSSGVYVLPVRFDDTDLPGALDTVFSLDARTASPAELADGLYARITQAEPPRGPSEASRKRKPAPYPQPTGMAAFSHFTQNADTINNIAGDVLNLGPGGTRDA
ncbi:MAG TPA: TIR domain-containing protein [Pseudonocardiaceae bacterium]|nr:TIR domain-containing protein [Pseudonocardiaceae bacterium]